MYASVKKLAKQVTGKYGIRAKLVCSALLSAYTYSVWNYTQILSTLNGAQEWCNIWTNIKKNKCQSDDHTSNSTCMIYNKRKEGNNEETSGIKPPKGELRIILLGATGSGKSSTGNVLLNDNTKFKTSCYARSETTKSTLRTLQIEKPSYFNKIDIIDTPAICDNGITVEDECEIQKAIALSSPGPHVFLLCVPCTTVTKYYTDVLKHYEKYFGDEIYDFVIVAFTKYDHIESERRFETNTVQRILSKRFHALHPNLVDNAQIFLSNVNKKDGTDELEKIIETITASKRIMKESHNEAFASCKISKHAESKLHENIKKMRKLTNISKISRDAVKTNPGHLNQIIVSCEKLPKEN